MKGKIILMKRWRTVIQLLLIVFVIGAAVILVGARNHDNKITKVTSQLTPRSARILKNQYDQSKTATVFLHGYNGGAYSTNYLIRKAEKRGLPKKR